ncbi:hypothetical protein EVAR_87830_1 [Eumeta japonica]|uniref:Uncharacterized protein n=1 Tax=Eumeta variegata TaxID=151549 RepID=A0A4C1YCY5_EUMVA|nr:hypothetical protein EVAR_87830_1 [Eumeta japonica]
MAFFSGPGYACAFIRCPRDSSCKERPIRRVDFRSIESKWPGYPNLSSIPSHTVGTAILFFDIHTGPYRNGRRYLAALNDYHQRSVALLS